MALKFTPYILPLVTGSIPLVIVAVTIAWRRAERLYAPFVLLLLGVAEWCLTYALEIASTTLKSALFWARAEYIGVALVGACMPICALVYSSRERHITLRNVLLLCVAPVITVVSVYTNDLHFAFWTSYGYDPSAPVFALQLGHGVLFWVNIAYSYAALLFATTAFLVMLRRSKGLLRVHIILLLLAALVPLVSHVLHLTGLSPVHFIELTPLSFAISGLMLAWGVFRKRLFDIVPIARHAVEFLRAGVDARHLRGYRQAAEREASLYEQLVTPRYRQRNPQARADALRQLKRLDQLGGQLRAALTRQALRHHFES